MSRVSPLLTLVITAALSAVALTGARGLASLRDVRRQTAALLQQNLVLEAEVGELRNRLQALQVSPFALEKKAREDLGLSKPGEIVYLFDNVASQRR